MLISAPSQAGKSTFVRKLIDSAPVMIDPVPNNFFWCYSLPQPWMSQTADKITFHKGLIDLDKIPPNSLLVIDDLQNSLSEKDSKIATQTSHHRNINVIYITQNLFYKGKAHRDLSLNANYVVLFKNPRDKMQASALGRQIFPGKADFFQKAYEDATRDPFSYLLIRLRQTDHDSLRLSSKVFPGEKIAFYLPA